MTQQVLPGDTNVHGTVFGGKVMQWIDIAGAVCAMRHAREMVVTASFDRVDFHAPARLGHIMVLKAQVNYAGRTSLEVGVQVLAENPLTGERLLTTDALITYVGIDKVGKPIPVPPVLPETEEEIQRYKTGEARRSSRKYAQKIPKS
ncbi:MAG: acyl-CoA thioesterase [Bdellovibrionales bacterium]|nr:acyl-CoA thioesterase [Bdellovibrionales bacterium]